MLLVLIVYVTHFLASFLLLSFLFRVALHAALFSLSVGFSFYLYLSLRAHTPTPTYTHTLTLLRLNPFLSFPPLFSLLSLFSLTELLVEISIFGVYITIIISIDFSSP